MLRMLGRRSLCTTMVGLVQLNLIPFYDGKLSAVGGLPRVFELDMLGERVYSQIRTMPGWYEKRVDSLTLMPPFEKGKFLWHTPKIVDLKHDVVRVFHGDVGDSALFRSRDGTPILIDGGLLVAEATPPFWLTVAGLEVINLVILTHGDNDHVGGLLALLHRRRFEKESCPRIKQVLVAHEPPPPQPTTRTWSDQNELADAAYALHDDGLKVLNSATTGEHMDVGDDVKLTFVLPTSKFKNKADAALQAAGRLTPINKWGIVVATAIRDGEKSLLFTGDADGKHVIQALNSIKMGDRKWDYVDMPHHGSQHNHPKQFLHGVAAKGKSGKLSGILTKNLVVSTKPHEHRPSLEAVKQIATWAAANAAEAPKIHFNYNHPDLRAHLKGCNVTWGPSNEESFIDIAL
jgi:hypothetical protein